MKRALLAAVTLLTIVAVGYAYSATRRERQFAVRVLDGDAALARGDLPAAVAAFAAAVSLKPDSMLGYLKRGDAHRRRGELEAAAADLERAHALNPTEPRVLELLGDVATARQLHDAAAKYYTAYVAIDDRPKVLYKLGLARHLGGHHREAANALRAAIKIDSRFAEAHYLLGVCQRAMRQLPAAQASLERAVAVAPNLLAAREQLADIHGLLGRRTERIKQLNELLLADASPARQVLLATAHAEAGQVSRAIVMLRAAADLYPTYPGTYLALGRLWLDVADAGDHIAAGKAVEALQQAVSMDASSAALTLLGRARLLAADAPSAERTLRQATETLPVEPAAFLHLADAADRTGHAAVARRALLDYEALTGAAEPDFLVRMAHAHWRGGDMAAAKATLQRVFTKHPEHEGGRSLERRMR